MSSTNFFRISGVHYTDLLDFLKQQTLKFGNLDNYFGQLTNNLSSQVELMLKVSDVYTTIESLKKNMQDYWKSVYSRTRIVRIVLGFLVASLIITGIVLIGYEIKNMKKEKLPGLTQGKHIVLYLSILFISISIVLLIERNLKHKQKQALKMKASVDDDYTYLKTTVLVMNEKIIKAMVLYNYGEKRARQKTKEMYKTLESICKSDNSIFTLNDLYGIFIKDKTGLTTHTDLLYNFISPKMNEALKVFYSDGNGYDRMRKIIVSGSTVLMMKEMKSNMQNYYNLVQVDNSEDKEEDNEQQQQIIKNIVVKNLIEKNVIMQPNNGINIDENKKSALLQKNLDVQSTKGSFDALLRQLAFICYFVYPIFNQKMPEDPDFYANMPNNTNDATQQQIIGSALLAKFKLVYNGSDGTVSPYGNTANIAKNFSSTDYSSLINTINDLIKSYFIVDLDKLFQGFASGIQGDYMFVYDEKYMQTQLQYVITTVYPFRLISDSNYDTLITQYIAQMIIPQLWNMYAESDAIDQRKNVAINSFVTETSDALISSDIKSITKFRPFILDELNKNPIAAANDAYNLNIYNSVLMKLEQAIVKKHTNQLNSTKLTNDTIDYSRFSPYEGFEQKINDMSLRDLTADLNATYLSDIVNSFYKKISADTQEQKNTIYDLYYEQNKTQDMLKMIVVVTVIMLVLGVIYFALTMAEEYSSLKFKHSNDEKALRGNKSDLDRLNNDFRDIMLVFVMKCIIFPVAIFFLIMLIISFYRKHVIKTTFNKEQVESNTADFKKALNDLNNLMSSIHVTPIDNNIGTLAISKETKEEIRKKIITTIDKYEKCNYINKAAQYVLPFPYTEITLDLFMIALVIIAFVYITSLVSPLDKISKIKQLYKNKEKIEYGGDIDKELQDEINEVFACHTADIDTLMFAMKIIGFMFVVIFLLFYSTLIMSSTNEFGQGLYNSMYFEQGRCYEL